MKIDTWLHQRFEVMESGDHYRINCPFCADRKTDKPLDEREDTDHHLYIAKSKPVGTCFRCEWSGHYVQLVMQYDSVSYRDAMDQLQGVVGLGDSTSILERLLFSDTVQQISDPVVEDYPKGYEPLQIEATNTAHYMARRYLESRGLTQAEWVQWGITPHHPGYVFTNIDTGFWQGRNIINWNPKYLNADIAKATNGVIFNHHRLNQSGMLFICEGVFSVLTFERVTGSHAVGLLGKTAIPAQLKRLASYPDPITILLDSDAHSASLVLADQLKAEGKHDLYLGRLDYGDPDECQTYTAMPYTPMTILHWKGL